jgi:hypothetical protein
VAALATLFVERMRVAQANRQQKLSTLIRLVEKRLEVYPLLYPYLSRFIKNCNYNAVFRQTPVSKAELQEFLDSINECDSKMSFIFSDETGKSMRVLQKEMLSLLSQNVDQYDQEDLSFAARKAWEMEAALRSDVAINGVELSREPLLQRKLWNNDDYHAH